MLISIGEHLELDDELFELRRDGQRVPLEPQAFDVLLYLVGHRDRVVPKEELMDQVWGGRFVSETAVTGRIKEVRRSLGDDGQRQAMLRTVHGRGYHFIAPVRVRASGATPAPRNGDVDRPVRYAVSDGLDIAYQVTGRLDTGPDIVLIAGFASHLDLDWADPRHAYFLDRLGSMGRLIRFDKRGTGMSDRPDGVPDLETRMHDVLAVMDAAGSERALLFGYSEGGPMAFLMAASHPERVSALVAYGTYARRLWSEDNPWAPTGDDRAEFTDELIEGWDWAADMRMRVPSADEAMQQWWTRRMRASATPSTIRALLAMNSLVDVRSVLPLVRVPTLVVHRRGDRLFPVDDARYLAEHIPGAELRVLDGDAHFVSGDPAQLLDAVEPFVTGTGTPANHTALAAVVASEPVSPPVVTALTGAGGRVRRTSAGDPVVLFDGPATAARAGMRALAAYPDLGLGLTIAEVGIGEEVATGAHVDAAVGLAAVAARGSLLVSGPAAALLSGSGIRLEQATPSVGGDLGAWRAVGGPRSTTPTPT